mgnify:CR=1 FL=1
MKKAAEMLEAQKESLRGESLENLFESVKTDLLLVKQFQFLLAGFSASGHHTPALNSGKKALFFFSSLCQTLETLFRFPASDVRVDPSSARDFTRRTSTRPALLRRFADFFAGQRRVARAAALAFAAGTPRQAEPPASAFDLLASAEFADSQRIDASWVRTTGLQSFARPGFLKAEAVQHRPGFSELFCIDFLGLLQMTAAALFCSLANEARLQVVEALAEESSRYKIRSVFEQTNLAKVQRNKKFEFSERLHSKAIDLLKANFGSFPLLYELLASYHRNYSVSHQLEEVPETEERPSVLTSEDHPLDPSAPGFEQLSRGNFIQDMLLEQSKNSPPRFLKQTDKTAPGWTQSASSNNFRRKSGASEASAQLFRTQEQNTASTPFKRLSLCVLKADSPVGKPLPPRRFTRKFGPYEVERGVEAFEDVKRRALTRSAEAKKRLSLSKPPDEAPRPQRLEPLPPHKTQTPLLGKYPCPGAPKPLRAKSLKKNNLNF